MKNLSHVFVSIFCIGLLQLACTNQEVAASGDYVVVALTEVPAPVVTYVGTYFTNLDIDTVKMRFNEDGTFRKYEMKLSNNLEIYFDILWAPTFDDNPKVSDPSTEILLTDLPQISQDYVVNYYSEFSVKSVKQQLTQDSLPRQYEVRFKTSPPQTATRLYFNTRGQFTGIKN